MLLITVAAALLAATFPLVCHVALPADAQAGSGLGLLYFGNIVGAALGSFFVGFVLMNVWGLRQLSIFLVLLGTGLGFALLALSGSGRGQLAKALIAGAVAVTSIIFLANPLFDQLYERLLYKGAFAGQRFRYLLENRSGVIAVSQDGTVFGGGAYDGAFNIDLVHDVNRPAPGASAPRPSACASLTRLFRRCGRDEVERGGVHAIAQSRSEVRGCCCSSYLIENARVIPSGRGCAGVRDWVTGLRKLPSPAVQCFNSLRKRQLFLREKSCITKRFRLRRMFLELPEILLQCEIQPEVLHLAQTFQLGSKFV